MLSFHNKTRPAPTNKTKPAPTFCTDVCDEARINGCLASNKGICSANSRKCGECISGYKRSVQLKWIKRRPSDTRRGGWVRQMVPCCVDICDADAMNECSDLNRTGCSPGNTTCGTCKAGFKDDGTDIGFLGGPAAHLSDYNTVPRIGLRRRKL